jgi:hypothetical protein
MTSEYPALTKACHMAAKPDLTPAEHMETYAKVSKEYSAIRCWKQRSRYVEAVNSLSATINPVCVEKFLHFAAEPRRWKKRLDQIRMSYEHEEVELAKA